MQKIININFSKAELENCNGINNIPEIDALISQNWKISRIEILNSSKNTQNPTLTVHLSKKSATFHQVYLPTFPLGVHHN